MKQTHSKDTMYRQHPLAVSAAMWPEHVITHKVAPRPRIVYMNLH